MHPKSWMYILFMLKSQRFRWNSIISDCLHNFNFDMLNVFQSKTCVVKRFLCRLFSARLKSEWSKCRTKGILQCVNGVQKYMCFSFQHQGKLGLRLNEISARDDHCKTLLNRTYIYCGFDSIAILYVIACFVHNPHDGYKWAFFSFRFLFRFHILEDLMHN